MCSVTAASIARLVILIVGLYGFAPNPDPTYNIGFVTSAIETNLALITASAPALMPLLKSWFPSVFGHNEPSGREKATMRNVRTKATPRDSDEEGLYTTSSGGQKQYG